MVLAATKISINLAITVEPVWRKKAQIRPTYLSHLGNGNYNGGRGDRVFEMVTGVLRSMGH